MFKSLTSTFSNLFNSPPEFGVRAPGRINLIGEHIDYLNGLVMPMAIDRAIYSAVVRNQMDEIRIWTSFLDGGIRTNDVIHIPTSDNQIRNGMESWLNYPVGVLSSYRDQGIPCPGFDVAIDTDLPPGAGLSSSAALETTFALIIEKLTGNTLDVIERAKICQRAEHKYAGVPCGLMDQLAVGASENGKALLIDCQSNSLTPVCMPDDISIVVSDTQVKHALGDGEYKNRRDDCEAALQLLPVDSWRKATPEIINQNRNKLGKRLFHRARHAVSEIARVSEFTEALELNDRHAIGKLLKESHESLRHDFEVSCPELDLLVETAYEFGESNGFIGARMTGGGFGGSTITLIQQKSAPLLIEHLNADFQATFGKKIEPFVTTPSMGATYINL